MNSIVIGAQWGDEGKGKITDLITRDHGVIIRFQGGNNAGHTLVVGGTTYKLRLVPSGILHPDKICILGNGMVIDPKVLLAEMDELAQLGISLANLHISERAHAIMPYHKMWEAAEEEERGDKKIGTTLRGIGPCYADKFARNGLHLGEICDEQLLRDKLMAVVPRKQKLLHAFSPEYNLDIEKIVEEYSEYGQRLRPYLADSGELLAKLAAEGKHLLFEGAQGTLLDIDHGTYPFVTSSNTIASAASSGTGISLRHIHRILGVAKAYTTRVGSGPFPSEIAGEIGEKIREQGREFGTVTGRPRRCGWLDLVALRYAHRLNGFDQLVITKLDVLRNINPIQLCVSYQLQGRDIAFPNNLPKLQKVSPVYESMPGWSEDISSCTDFAELPRECQAYVNRIEEIVGIPIAIISIGPGREQTILRREKKL